MTEFTTVYFFSAHTVLMRANSLQVASAPFTPFVQVCSTCTSVTYSRDKEVQVELVSAKMELKEQEQEDHIPCRWRHWCLVCPPFVP